jgi:hypothetical protein
MYQKLEVLSQKSHADLRLAQRQSFAFAAQELFVPVMMSEIALVAREYPLVFIKDQKLPVALLGAERNVNAYVAQDGSWRAIYVPAMVRAYPFALSKSPRQPNEFVLTLDMQAETVGKNVGRPLFEPDGKPSAILQGHIDLLRSLKTQEAKTAALVDHLRQTGLLGERKIRVSQDDADSTQLAGVEFVNEKALNELSREEFFKLRELGLLPLIYAHLLSMANLHHGTISGRYAPQRQSGPQQSEQIDLSSLSSRDPADQSPAASAVRNEADALSWIVDDGDFDLGTLDGSIEDDKKGMH